MFAAKSIMSNDDVICHPGIDEIRISKKVKHKNITAFVDAFINEETSELTMINEYV